jgi:hypothetical protein
MSVDHAVFHGRRPLNRLRMDTKTCIGPCKRELPLTAFSPKGAYRHSRCRDCRNVAARIARSTPNPRALARLT